MLQLYQSLELPTPVIDKLMTFEKYYFPDWTDAKIYCDSWLLSPALKELLYDNSNIINFQKLFIVESVDYDSLAVLD